MSVSINPVAVLSVAAAANTLVTLTGKESPDWLKMLAVGATGMAFVTNMRQIIERREAEEAGAIDEVKKGSDWLDDAQFVYGRLTGAPGVPWY